MAARRNRVLMCVVVTLVPPLIAVAAADSAAAPPTTTATIDLSVRGDRFDGIGGVSGGGGGARLLVDYAPALRDDLLDLLFTPNFGLSLHHLKVEIGCDGDTTQGSEPTHARSATDVSFDRSYEVWIMQEATKRNPRIQLSGLEWGVPGWVAASPGGGGRYGGMWSPANVKYMVGWATGLRDQKGLNLSALAVAYNERGYNATFIKAVRKGLDAAGLAHVQTIAADASGSGMSACNAHYCSP